MSLCWKSRHQRGEQPRDHVNRASEASSSDERHLTLQSPPPARVRSLAHSTSCHHQASWRTRYPRGFSLVGKRQKEKHDEQSPTLAGLVGVSRTHPWLSRLIGRAPTARDKGRPMAGTPATDPLPPSIPLCQKSFDQPSERMGIASAQVVETELAPNRAADWPGVPSSTLLLEGGRAARRF